MRYVYRFIRNL